MTEKNSFWFYDHFSEFYYDFLTRSVSYKWYNDKFNNVYCTFSASFLVIIEAIHPFAGLHTPHIPIKAKRSTYGYKLPNLLLKVKDPSSDKAVLAAVRHESSPNDVTADKAGGKLGESDESFDKVSACWFTENKTTFLNCEQISAKHGLAETILFKLLLFT